jgi:hypothetical protein
MKKIELAGILVLAVASICSGGTSDPNSLNDNPMRFQSMNLPATWTGARWEAERVDHTLDILSSMVGCNCTKARAILEDDLRKQEVALENEVKRMREAEAQGHKPLDFADREKKSAEFVAAVELRAKKYCAARAGTVPEK